MTGDTNPTTPAADVRPHVHPEGPAREGETDRTFALHRTEAGYPNCATCDGGGCPDCTDPA